jgi:hypothetical protein
MHRQLTDRIVGMGYDPSAIEGWRRMNTEQDAKAFSMAFLLDSIDKLVPLIQEKVTDIDRN